MTRVRNRYPRIPCLVPFCGCGATCYPPDETGEIICPKHYRLVDRSLKARRRRVRAAFKRRGELWSDRHWRMEHKLWNRIREQAITRAAGAPA